MEERPFSALIGAKLRAQVLGVGVDASLGVVDEIPAGMIGVIVDDKVVTRAIPAPTGGEVPIPRSDFKREAAGEPEAVRARIEAFHVIAVGRAKVFEAAMRIGMRDSVAFVVGTIVAVPVVIVNVGNAVDTPAGPAIDFRLGVDFAACGRFGNVAAVGVHVVMMLGGPLCACSRSARNGRCECQC